MTREEAIKILRKLLAEDEDIDFFSYDEKKAVEYFISLSENKGEWIRWYEVIENETGTTHIPHCKCSKCEVEQDPYRSRFINFCPNCGSDNRG